MNWKRGLTRLYLAALIPWLVFWTLAFQRAVTRASHLATLPEADGWRYYQVQNARGDIATAALLGLGAPLAVLVTYKVARWIAAGFFTPDQTR